MVQRLENLERNAFLPRASLRLLGNSEPAPIPGHERKADEAGAAKTGFGDVSGLVVNEREEMLLSVCFIRF